jgi:hypothetical protein
MEKPNEERTQRTEDKDEELKQMAMQRLHITYVTYNKN